MSYTIEEFVRSWQTLSTIDDVAKDLGISVMGVELKKRNGSKINLNQITGAELDQLKSLAKELS